MTQEQYEAIERRVKLRDAQWELNKRQAQGLLLLVAGAILLWHGALFGLILVGAGSQFIKTNY